MKPDPALAIEKKLNDFVEQSGFQTPRPHYITGEFNIELSNGSKVYSNESYLYCWPCARARRRQIIRYIKRTKRNDYRVFETDANEDCCCHCHLCGRTLDYWLSTHGVENEIEHFEGYKFEILDPDDAYHVARLIGSASDNHHENYLKTALRIGRRAVKAIPKLPELVHPTPHVIPG